MLAASRLGNPAPFVNNPNTGLVIPWWKTVVVVLLGGLTAFGFWGTESINQKTAAGVSMTLPDLVGSFQGTPQEVSESEKVVLPADTEFSKMLYKNVSGDQVNVQVVLAGAEKRSIHRPEVCLPAQGWTIDARNIVPVTLDNGERMDVMRLVLSRPVEVRPGEFRNLKSVFLYWFVGDRVTTASHWMRLFLTSWDRVVHRQNHRWAYVIASAPALKDLTQQGWDVKEAETALKTIVAGLAPDIVLKWKKNPVDKAPSP